MNNIRNVLKIKRYADDVKSPVYATKGAACFDVHAYSYKSFRSFDVAISEEDTAVFGTGLFFEIPKGKALMVYSRSGQAFKSDVSLSNCVGVIDSDYTGELMIKLRKDRNVDNGYQEAEPFVIKHGDRIAQCMLVDAPQIKFEFVTEIHQTERADKGLGSTGYSERVIQ